MRAGRAEEQEESRSWVTLKMRAGRAEEQEGGLAWHQMTVLLTWTHLEWSSMQADQPVTVGLLTKDQQPAATSGPADS